MLKMSPYGSIAVRTLHLTPLPITTEHNDDTEVVTVFLPHHHIGGGEQYRRWGTLPHSGQGWKWWQGLSLTCTVHKEKREV